MSHIPYTNDRDQIRYVGGHLVRPKETVIMDARHVPQHMRPAPPPPEEELPPDPMAELRKGNVRGITAMLPELSTEQLAALEVLEQEADNTRTTLLEAIEAERLKRAQDPNAGGGEGGQGDPNPQGDPDAGGGEGA